MLVKLKAKTIPRNEGSSDTKLVLHVYAEDLAPWPADIVRKTLASWPSRSKFWPSWCELEEQMQRTIAKRRALVEFLEVEVSRAGVSVLN